MREWFRPPRHLLALFLAITSVPAGVLAWLGWRLTEQDRVLERQRIAEQLEHAADRIAAAVERRLAQAVEELASTEAIHLLPAGDALIVRATETGVAEQRGARLAYLPNVPAWKDPATEVFAAGEALEFQQQDHERALAEFRRLASTAESATRAGALVRVARVLRKQGELEAALGVYQQLENVSGARLGDAPAELAARHARCVTLEQMGRRAELERAAGELEKGLVEGRWAVDRDTWEFYSGEAQRWREPRPEPVSVALAAAVEWLWQEWRDTRSAAGSRGGRRSLWMEEHPILVVWQGSTAMVRALVAGPQYLQSQWQGLWEPSRFEVRVSDEAGHVVLGPPALGPGPKAVRAASETGLPWTIQVASADPGSERAQLAARSRILLAGLAMIAVLLLTGGYLTVRAISRELAVSRLQSDFVSAVSHEFRTPLSSLRHLTEILSDGTGPGEERRRQYYAALSRQTERLHTLVESLLSFGRMEAGTFEYQFEPVDAGDLARSVVAEFRSETGEHVPDIGVSVDGAALVIQADREPLGRALWNLLDNAVKYSPESSPVEVEVQREGDWVEIGVKDNGQGIPAEERSAILQKFVRGTAAKAGNVKGTGIGLAIVRHIVEAHGGELRIESEPGRGSRFTMRLPAVEEDG